MTDRSSRSTAPESFIVCRCEEVSLHDIEAAVAAGYEAPELLKRATRVSMGACQGRVCRPILRTFWRHHQAASGDDARARPAPSSAQGGHIGIKRDSRASLPVHADLDLPGSRPPVRPIRLGDLADLEPPDEPATPSQGNR